MSEQVQENSGRESIDTVTNERVEAVALAIAHGDGYEDAASVPHDVYRYQARKVLAVIDGMVTDEMIERGARALHESVGWSKRSYDSQFCGCKQRAEAVLRAALEAPDER